MHSAAEARTKSASWSWSAACHLIIPRKMVLLTCAANAFRLRRLAQSVGCKCGPHHFLRSFWGWVLNPKADLLVLLGSILGLWCGPWGLPNCILGERMLLQHCSCVTGSGSLASLFLCQCFFHQILYNAVNPDNIDTGLTVSMVSGQHHGFSFFGITKLPPEHRWFVLGDPYLHIAVVDRLLKFGFLNTPRGFSKRFFFVESKSCWTSSWWWHYLTQQVPKL